MASSGNPAWSARFPAYQIDFTALDSGKRVATSKRRIRWRFGFPNKEALEGGQTGTDCRGEEHDVTIVWSVASGKRQVTMDGREVHYSTSRSGLLDYSWATRANHVMKVIAHAAPPLSATPGFRQYDLLIDGQSFFSMPKVFELGIRGPIPAHARVPGMNYSAPRENRVSSGRMRDHSRGENIAAPTSRDQEEAELQAAIQASLEESRMHLAKHQALERDNYSTHSTPQVAATTEDLLDLGGPSPAPTYRQNSAPPADARSVVSFASQYSAPPTFNPASTPQYQNNSPYNTGAAPYQSPPPLQQANPVTSPDPSIGGQIVPAQAPPGYYGAPRPGGTPDYRSPPPVPPGPAQTPEYVAPVQTPNYAPAPSAPAPEFLNAPTQPTDVFGLQSPPEDDPFAPKPPPPPTHNDIHNAILGAYAPAAPTTPSGLSQPPQGFTSQADATPDQPSPQVNGHSHPQQNGGNLTMGTLAIEAAEEEPLNPVDAAMKKLVNIDHIDEPAEEMQKLTLMQKEETKKTVNGRSKGLPPAASGYVGSNATLSHIAQVKPDKPKPNVEDIMKPPPPTLFQPGVVNAGALVVHGQGPPPLQQARGFGVGAHLPNGGLQQQNGQAAYQPGYNQHAHPGYQQS